MNHKNQAIRIGSLPDNAYFLLGNAFFYQRMPLESIAAYEACMVLNPKDVETLRLLGVAAA